MAKLYKILSIDGGGIRGILPGQVLVHVETKLQQLTGNKNSRIGDHFDLLAGTSTGGILTCAYLCPGQGGKPKFSAPEVVDLYFERGDEIFDIPFFHKLRTAKGLLDEKYPADGLEEALEDYFDDLQLAKLLKPTVITSYDIRRRKPHFFKQHRAKEAVRNFLVKDVARATSAAPTYFECARIKSFGRTYFPLVDGGVFANNPTLCAYAEGRNIFPKPGKSGKKATAVDFAILSIGTGHSKKQYHYNDAKNWGLAQWAKPVIDIMMSGVSDTVHYQLDQIYEAVNAPNQYLRIDSVLPKEVDPDMDNVEPENLEALRNLGDQLAKKYDKQLTAFLKL